MLRLQLLNASSRKTEYQLKTTVTPSTRPQSAFDSSVNSVFFRKSTVAHPTQCERWGAVHEMAERGCLRGNFGPSGKWAASALSKGWGRTHIANSRRSGTFKRPGAGVAIRAPATQTLPPVAGEGKVTHRHPHLSAMESLSPRDRARR